MLETAICLTLVAVGTSLPELAFTTVVAIKGQADLTLGNVIGSNILNLLAIVGIATFVGPITVSEDFLRFDFWIIMSASLFLILFVFLKFNTTRIWGAALTLLYMAYVLVSPV